MSFSLVEFLFTHEVWYFEVFSIGFPNWQGSLLSIGKDCDGLFVDFMFLADIINSIAAAIKEG